MTGQLFLVYSAFVVAVVIAPGLRAAHSSLRAKRSNPLGHTEKAWIASVALLLAMTSEFD